MSATRFIVLSIALAAGCAKKSPQETPAAIPPSQGSSAMGYAMMANGDGQPMGTITAMQTQDGLTLQVNMRGVPGEAGPHGFHFHEGTECVGPLFESAGGHFSPYGNQPHGRLTDQARHGGDMGNVMSNADGVINTEVHVPSLTLTDGRMQATGHVIILHSGEDDGTSQPAGNSGKKIACGKLTMGMMPDTTDR